MIQTTALFEQIQHGVQQLDAQAGRSRDEKSDNMAASLHALALEKGFVRVDHVLIGGRGLAANPGDYVFIVQGDPKDPAHLRACLKTVDAISVPQADSHARAQGLAGQVQATAAPALDVPVQQPAAPRLG
jgi:hypothetical protein